MGLQTTALQAPPSMWISIILLAIFLVISYSMLKVVKNTIIAGILGLAFPFVSNWLLGTGFGTNLVSLLNFAIISVALYLIYISLNLLYHTSKLAFKIITLLLLPLRILASSIKAAFGKKSKEEKKKRRN